MARGAPFAQRFVLEHVGPGLLAMALRAILIHEDDPVHCRAGGGNDRHSNGADGADDDLRGEKPSLGLDQVHRVHRFFRACSTYRKSAFEKSTSYALPPVLVLSTV